MSDKPNVILICVDQWRGDCLSIAGHPVVHTPFLDRLALKGARFTRAYTAVPSCIAARAALYTGLGQRTHGRVGYQDGVPWDYPVTIAGEFTRHGYQTQAVGKMHVYPERSQMGFQNVILGQSVQWVTDGHEKFVWFSGTGHEQLFDLDDDPRELHDLAGDSTAAGRVAHWREVLMEELAGREEGFTDGERLIPGRPVKPCLAHLRREAGLE